MLLHCIRYPHEGPRTLSEHIVSGTPEDQATDWYSEWLKAVQNDADAKLFQHPVFVLNELYYKRAARNKALVLLTVADEQQRTLTAVLAPQESKHRMLFGYLPSLKTSGFRLAGGRFVGHQSMPLKKRLLRCIADLMSGRKATFTLIEDFENHRDLWTLVSGKETPSLSTFVTTTVQAKHRITLDESKEAYWKSMSSRRRKQFRNRFNRAGDLRMERVTEPGQVSEFLTAANRISANSWQAKVQGVRVGNDLRHQKLLGSLAEHGFLRSYLLYKDDVPVAFEIGYQYGSYMHGFEAGFDLNHAKLSPGNLLMYLEINDLFEHCRPAVYDLGEGDAPYKQVFSNQVTYSAKVWAMPKGLRSRALQLLIQSNRALESLSRKTLDSLQLKTRIRQLYRRLGTATPKRAPGRGSAASSR